MTVTDALQGIQTIAVDAAPIVYFVENSPVFYDICAPFFVAIGTGQVQAITSALAYTETLAVPLRNNDTVLIRAFYNLLSATRGISVVPVSVRLADKAADLRARYRLSTPDAVQIATAIDAGCDAFLTNDGALRRVSEITVLYLGDLTV